MDNAIKMVLRTWKVLIERLPRSLSTSQRLHEPQPPSQSVPNKVSNKHIFHRRPVSAPDSSDLTNAEYKINVTKHRKDVPKPKPFKCKVCAYSTKYSTHLKYHILSHTGEKPYSCQYCKKGFKSNTTKKHHKIICKLNPKHSDPNWIKMQKTIRCDYCDFGTLTKAHLQDHLLTHAGYESRPFPCALCGFRSLTSSSLGNHMRTHTRERPFECPSCAYRAPRTSQIHQHINASHNEGNRHKFHCKTCPKSYFTKCHLNRHMMTHTGERPHSCQFCLRCFTQKSDKNIHENICKLNPNPAKKKPIDEYFKCTKPGCEFSAATRWQLRSHSVKHSTARPFKCQVCNKSFKSKSYAKRHHRTEKLYECNLCNDKFSTQKSLHNHIRNHLGEKPHACQFCQRRFVELQIKKKHAKICRLNPNKTSK